jgi:hypothetical protein
LPRNQIQLPSTRIFLDAIFTADSIRGRGKSLEIDQPLDAVAFGETFDQSLAVFPNAGGKGCWSCQCKAYHSFRWRECKYNRRAEAASANYREYSRDSSSQMLRGLWVART